jgi:hypothetical protein
MKYLKKYKIFESADDNDKYLLNLSSANSQISLERWLDYSNVSDVIKRGASSWSLYPMLNKLTRIPISARNLSNNEIANQIKVRGIGPMRLGLKCYGEGVFLSKDLFPKFHYLFQNFKRLPIEKKVEFMAELQSEDYVFCPNSDIIKIIDKKDLEYELDMISSKFQYFLLGE